MSGKRATKIAPPDEIESGESDVDVIDVEAEETTTLIDGVGTMDTPDLPAIPDGGRVELREEPRRVDALRLGDELHVPVSGVVTGVVMQADGRVALFLDGDVRPWLVPMNQTAVVVVPRWRPGEPLDQIGPMRAWGRVAPEVARTLAESAR